MMETLDILLVRPINRSLQVTPPLSLGYLATALRKNDFSVRILDCVKEDLDYPKFESHVRKYNPRVIGLQVFTADLPTVTKSIEIAKKINPSIMSIVGGAHPSSVPQETLEYFKNADFGFCGEAEISLVQFMKIIRDGRINRENLRGVPGLIWRDKGNIIINKTEFVDDLDSLGFPSWDLLKPHTYPERVQGYFFRKFPVAPIMPTRGCPYDCTFCAAKLINGRKIRRHSIGHVIEEIQLLQNKYGIREIHIIDDNFTFNRDYVMEFCRELIKSGLDIPWRCANSMRLDCIDMEMLKVMKRSGCYKVAFGIESGSNRILKKMKKGFDTDAVIRGVDMARRAGLNVNGSFILGYPGETEQERRQTLKFSRRLGMTMANFNCLIPLPGTEVYNESKTTGTLKFQSWEHFNFSDVTYVPEDCTEKKLKSYQRKAILLFYLRPKPLINLIKNIRTFRHFCFIAKSTFIFLFIARRNKVKKENLLAQWRKKSYLFLARGPKP